MRIRLFIISALFLVGCGGAPVPTEPEVPDASQESTPSMRAEGLSVHYYPPGSTSETHSVPVLTLRADHYIDAGDNRYEIEGVYIEIAEEPTQPPIVIECGKGNYEKDASAQLMDGVKVVRGDIRIDTEQLNYTVPDEDSPGVISTEAPVTIKSPNQDISASSLRMIPQTGDVELTDYSGLISFGEMDK